MIEIDWTEGHHTSRNGRVGPLYLFVISWRSARDDPNWVMRCALPGLEGKRWKDDDENVLRGQAVKVLQDWLQQVFGIRPSGETFVDPAFEHYAEVAELGHDIRPLMHEAFDAGWLARAGETQ